MSLPVSDRMLMVPDVDGLQPLTQEEKVEAIAQALGKATFVFDDDDVMLLATASDFAVTDKDAYTRGFAMLGELGGLRKRIDAWYTRFKGPINRLAAVVDGVKRIDATQVDPVKETLSKTLATWKIAQDERDRRVAAAEQRVRDAAAQAEQQAKAETLRRIAAAEEDAALRAAFEHEAESVAAVVVKAAPVEQVASAPKVFGGSIKTNWSCQFDDIRELMQAWLDGRCVLDEQAIIDGLQASMDVQAAALGHRIGQSYPGCSAVAESGAVARRKPR